MGKKLYFVVVVSLLVSALIISTVLAAPSPGNEDLIVKALNPAGRHMPLEVQGLAPRLDTIDGKTIYIHQGEADPVLMPALLELVKKKYPNVKWRYIAHSDFGPRKAENEVLAEADAVIKGVAW